MPEPQAAKPVPPPQKWCHRYMIPAVYQEAREVPNIVNKGAPDTVVEIKTGLVHVPCTAKCTLFDAATGECWELQEKRAAVASAKALEDLVALERAGDSA